MSKSTNGWKCVRISHFIDKKTELKNLGIVSGRDTRQIFGF